jgi:DNA-binding response OmpR family regulator
MYLRCTEIALAILPSLRRACVDRDARARLLDMQGLELLRQIRARKDTVSIVVLSSRGDEDAKVAALDQGADDYVTKPFGMEELLTHGRRLHHLHRQGECHHWATNSFHETDNAMAR